MKYFTLDELTRSDTARRLGIDNRPAQRHIDSLRRLVDDVLDPLREAWGKPITVNSGYRCPELNRAVGGARASQHMLGQAADITVGNKADNRRLFQLVQSLNLPFTQLIDESDFAWVHIGHDPSNVKRQVLKL